MNVYYFSAPLIGKIIYGDNEFTQFLQQFGDFKVLIYLLVITVLCIFISLHLLCYP